MRSKIIFCIIAILLIFTSCKKVKNYFHDPETEVIARDIQTSYAIAYAANVAMTEVSGHHLPNVKRLGKCNSFPCSSLMIINVSGEYSLPFMDNKIGKITVAGLWASEETAILNILFSDFELSEEKFELLGINLVPVSKQFDQFIIAFARMDIDLNPNSDALLSLDFDDNEVDSKFNLLNGDRPEDLDLAVEQNAYFIDINQNNTYENISDDIYTITGGGQLVEVAGSSANVTQQAILGVEVSSYCLNNPTAGYALIRSTNIDDKTIPELGTAILEFHESCDGKAAVTLGTGIYITSNGKSVPFNFD